jgi:hypothetical protein
MIQYLDVFRMVIIYGVNQQVEYCEVRPSEFS